MGVKNPNVKLSNFGVEISAQDDCKINIDAGCAYQIDPTIHEWARQPHKPEYRHEEILESPEPLTNLELQEIINNILGGL